MEIILSFFRDYYLNGHTINERVVRLIDNIISYKFNGAVQANPGFYRYFGFRDFEVFVDYFTERFWNEKLVAGGGLRLICSQETDEDAVATLRFLVEQYNNTSFITHDTQRAKDIVDKILSKLNDAGMITGWGVGNYRRDTVVAATPLFNSDEALQFFSGRFRSRSNNEASLVTVLMKLERGVNARYYDLVDDIVPFYAHLKIFTDELDSPGQYSGSDGEDFSVDRDDDRFEFLNETLIGMGTDDETVQSGETVGDKENNFGNSLENILLAYSSIIDNEPVQPDLVQCPIRNKAILLQLLKEAEIVISSVMKEIIRRVNIEEMNAIMLFLLLHGNMRGQAIGRIMALLGIGQATCYQKLDRFQNVMEGMREDEQYASTDGELIEIVADIFSVYQRICVPNYAI